MLRKCGPYFGRVEGGKDKVPTTSSTLSTSSMNVTWKKNLLQAKVKPTLEKAYIGP